MTPAQHFAEIGIRAASNDWGPSTVLIAFWLTTLYAILGATTAAFTNYSLSESNTSHTYDEIYALSFVGGVVWPLWATAWIFVGLHLFVRAFGRSVAICCRLARPVARLPRATLRRKS